MRRNTRTTISDVAEAAGVSRTAVSFAFNNPGQLAADTAERIFAAALRLDYSPSPVARALHSRRTGVIGILVPFSISASFANPFIALFMQGVGGICDEHGLGALIVSPLEGSLDAATRRAPVDGYIVLGLNEDHAEVAPLRRRGVPLVIVDGDAQTGVSINVDDEGGAHSAATHLLSKGHREILIITFQSPTPLHHDNVFYGVGGRRLVGYRRAFGEYGLPLHYEQMIPALTSIEGGVAAFSVAWTAGKRPTAILALSDAMAIGAITEANRLGLDVPGDLEVIGFDDVPLATLVRPALSTVHQPILEKGEVAARMLVSILDGSSGQEQIQEQEQAKVLLPTNLVLRSSTR